MADPSWKVNDAKPCNLQDSLLGERGATYTDYNNYKSTVRLEAQEAIRGWTVSCWVADIPSKKVTLLLGEAVIKVYHIWTCLMVVVVVD